MQPVANSELASVEGGHAGLILGTYAVARVIVEVAIAVSQKSQQPKT